MDSQERARYPQIAGQTTQQTPWPVRLLAENVNNYVAKMPALWVEGQVVEYKFRPGAKVQFLTLRDLEVDCSFTVKAYSSELPKTLSDGTRLVIYCKPDFYAVNGSLSLFARQIHIVGRGELLEKLENQRRALAAEGIFSAERKKPLPFLPRCIGIICGRAAKAQADVMQNVERRWPGMPFNIQEVAVQGSNCVNEVIGALTLLDADPLVDVIVITRGGGSLEDLLPFFEERLVRAVAACHTPVVSAIGHEEDQPHLDYVADFRASTPTDAAKRIVPDAAQEFEQIGLAQHRLRLAVHRRLEAAARDLEQIRSRPALAQPASLFDSHLNLINTSRLRLRSAWNQRLTVLHGELERATGALRALSPLATLQRGYAALRDSNRQVISSPEQVHSGQHLEAILAHGRLGVEVFALSEQSHLVPIKPDNQTQASSISTDHEKKENQ